MKISCAVLAATLALAPTASFAYGLLDSMKDDETCTQGTSFPSSVIAACSRLIENIDGEVMPRMKGDLDLYYLFRSIMYEEGGKKEKACADATTAVELIPKAKPAHSKWLVTAQNVVKNNCE